MARSVLIVEGRRDHALFESVISKILKVEPKELELDITGAGGKDRAKQLLYTYVSQGFARIGIARDINDSEPERVVRSIQDFLGAKLQSPVKREKGFILAGRSSVLVIPMGLHNDKELQDLGITRYAMEDYLVKIVLQDNRLTAHLRDFRNLLENLLALLKGKGIFLESSKEILQLIKAVWKFSEDNPAFTRKLIGEGDKLIIDSVMTEPLNQVRILTGLSKGWNKQ
jgi:hypothetical protein